MDKAAGIRYRGLSFSHARSCFTAVLGLLASDRQSDIAVKAEIDATEQNKIAALAQQDTREQLRSVLNISGIAVFPETNPETKESGYATAIVIHNNGGTRTAYFDAWASSFYFDKEVPDSWDFGKQLKALPLYDTILGANATYQLNSGFSTSDLTKAASNQGLAIVWGKAHYSDIFNVEVRHEVSFCFNINPTLVNGNLVFNPIPFRASCTYSR